MSGLTYKQLFRKAITKSDEWGCSSANDFEPAIPEGAKISHYFSVIEGFLGDLAPSPNLHLSCGELHFALWEALQAKSLPSFVTIGDVVWKGERLFGTTHDNLAAEWSGKHHGTTVDTKLHVWLTLPDGETVIDLTILPYLLGKLPDNFDWKQGLYVSGMVNARNQIEHVPMLFGITFLFQSGAVPMPFMRG